MVAMILAFFINAIAFLRFTTLPKVSYLLTLPSAIWFIMLVISVFKGIEIRLSLDFYTNPVIASAFLALDCTLKASKSKDN